MSRAPVVSTALSTVAAACPLCPDADSIEWSHGPDFEYGTTGDHEWACRRCVRCALVFLSPRPSDSELGRIYPSTYYAYDFSAADSLGFRVKTWLDRRSARAHLPFVKGDARVLDVGCGDGRLLRLFHELGVSKERLCGVEFEPRAANRALASGFDVQLGRFEDATFAPSTFGLVMLQQLIEHVSDPDAVVGKVRGLLAPGGAVVIETPDTDSLDHWLFRRRHWGGYHFPRHFHLFDRRSIAMLLGRHGLRVVEVRPVMSPVLWIQSVHHALSETPLRVFRRLVHPHRPGPIALMPFGAIDLLLGMTRGACSNMRVVAVRD